MSAKIQNVITWKDADTGICMAAGHMLQQANVYMRSSDEVESGHRTEDGKGVEPGMGEENSNRTWWTRGWEGSIGAEGIEGFLNPQLSDPPMDRICWYSFQNLIRMRLKEARLELMDALFTQRSRLRESDQRSRNRIKRRQGSKHGWSADD